jgi:twinkle protein
MRDLGAALQKEGIQLRKHDVGDHRTTCPQCSHTRRKKTDPCLSVTIDPDGGAVWNCWHCQWVGNVSGQERETSYSQIKPSPVRPAPVENPDKPESMFDWFEGRGISSETVERFGCYVTTLFFPQSEQHERCIAFPYVRGGEVLNHKYRTKEKHFRQDKGAEKTLFNIDSVAEAETAIFVEGELDVLACAEAGYTAVVSLPDGAPQQAKAEIDPDDQRFAALASCAAELKHVSKFIIATDGDDPGKALAEELSRRLGRERCWRVSWPAINDAPRKDANEVLVYDGAGVLRECIENAEPYPIRSLFDLGAFEGETVALYRDGPKRAFSTGWDALDEHMRIREGELSIVTGIPGSGKSEFIDALTVNLARMHGWHFGVCSFENPPDEHIAKLAEKYLGQPFWEGPTPRMSEGDLQEAVVWLKRHFFLIRADDESPTIDWVLEAARAAVLRYGIRGLIIDPYNELEHHRPSSMSETEYVSQLLSKVKRFAQGHGVHVWFVAHPQKIRRDSEGKMPIPNLYDISGSANWANKADLGVVVHRDWAEGSQAVEIYVRKIRFKAAGKVGVVRLFYDRITGRYTEAA